MNFATSTCTAVNSITTQCLYEQDASTPLVTQDAGNVSFGLAVIITLMAIFLVAFLFNSFGGKRRY